MYSVKVRQVKYMVSEHPRRDLCASFTVQLRVARGRGLSGGQEVIVRGDVTVFRQIVQLSIKLLVAAAVFRCLARSCSWL